MTDPLRQAIEELRDELRGEARGSVAKRGKARAYDLGWSHAFDEVATRITDLLCSDHPSPERRCTCAGEAMDKRPDEWCPIHGDCSPSSNEVERGGWCPRCEIPTKRFVPNPGYADKPWYRCAEGHIYSGRHPTNFHSPEGTPMPEQSSSQDGVARHDPQVSTPLVSNPEPSDERAEIGEGPGGESGVPAPAVKPMPEQSPEPQRWTFYVCATCGGSEQAHKEIGCRGGPVQPRVYVEATAYDSLRTENERLEAEFGHLRGQPIIYGSEARKAASAEADAEKYREALKRIAAGDNGRQVAPIFNTLRHIARSALRSSEIDPASDTQAKGEGE